ncbi:MAG: hypothetical protein H0T08_08755 [Acidobacteria bacterium]|nr:hypothetical protein [Acidobacteriota bacterium]
MAKHEKTFVDLDKPYETNVIGMRGIIYFAVGLFLLVVITFGLMWFLQNVMEEQSIAEKDVVSPMMMNEQERLPPEPRLQGAPGFGVDDERGRINLELKAPQSEYRNLQEQWETMWRDGQKDAKTGTVATLPMEEAKRRFLEQSAQKPEPNAQQKEEAMKKSRSIVSLSSAGRTASDIRR